MKKMDCQRKSILNLRVVSIMSVSYTHLEKRISNNSE